MVLCKLHYCFVQVSRNEELSLELLNLVNAKATLMKQLEVAEKRNYRLGNADEEVDRVRAMVGRYSRRKVWSGHFVYCLFCKTPLDSMKQKGSVFLWRINGYIFNELNLIGLCVYT